MPNSITARMIHSVIVIGSFRYSENALSLSRYSVLSLRGLSAFHSIPYYSILTRLICETSSGKEVPFSSNARLTEQNLIRTFAVSK